MASSKRFILTILVVVVACTAIGYMLGVYDCGKLLPMVEA
jgi:hypothetical protein